MRIEWKFTIFLTITILLNIQFYPKDQQKYFMIFNKFQLYIEKPHRHDESWICRSKKSSAKINFKPNEHAFYRMLEYSQPLTKEGNIESGLLLKKNL
ncbi:hypothetical protein [Methanobacterium sp.]|uniref:hypothetical protein n=1 Tax=Methanobacterium sp. TaxID=2164 RepID=UPI003C7917EA